MLAAVKTLNLNMDTGNRLRPSPQYQLESDNFIDHRVQEDAVIRLTEYVTAP